MAPDVESIVIGAGVVGLAIGRALAQRGQDVMVLEQHDLIGSETSSRNSEVIHAGIYYPPGSLRARLCVEGKAMLYRFCAENGVAHSAVTKLLVATAESQLPKLKAIHETAMKNGVADLVPMTGEEARRLEPELSCVAAMLSPSTGIIDSHGLMLALEGHVEAGGGQVVLNTPVTRLGMTPGGLYEVETGGESAVAGGQPKRNQEPATRLTCRRLIVSAGLHASKLARTLPWGGDSGAFGCPPATGASLLAPSVAHMATGASLLAPSVAHMATGASLLAPSVAHMATGAYRPPETYYAVGQYYAYSGKSPFSRHIYPMPDGAWLGLHVTVDIGGRCKFGPDIAWIPEIDYAFDELKLDKFLGFIRTYYPGLDASRLHADYTGIRPKLYREGEPVPDFFLHGPETHGRDGLMMLFGIESPGLTASLAIAELVADRI